MKPINIHHNGYLITTDKTLMQVEDIHKWLSEESYWSKGIPFEMVQNAFEHSFCIGALKDNRQIAYSRLITDYTTFGYLADVYTEEEHRGNGIAKKMLELLMNMDWVKKLRRMMLVTLDAHNLYSQYGFIAPPIPERYMEICKLINYETMEKSLN
jgi:GNAT superfamily N-acetyltransferase